MPTPRRRSPGPARPLVVVLVVLLGSILAARPAAAHSTLQSATPSPGSTVPSSPPVISLTFSEEVEVSLGAIRLFDPAGDEVDVGDPSHPAGRGDQVAVDVPDLGNGSYVVAWRVTSADAHPASGAFTFAVGEPSEGDTRGLVQRLVAEHGSTTVGFLNAVARFGLYVAGGISVGLVLFLLLCWPVGLGERRPMRALRWSLLASGILALAGIATQGAYGAGGEAGQILAPALWSDVAATHFGRAHLAMVLLAVIGVLLTSPAFLPRSPEARHPGPLWYGAIGAWTIGWGVAFALSGHASSGRWPGWAMVLDVVHVVAMAAWLGGLVGLLGLALGDPRLGDAQVAARRFSAVAAVSVAALALSGAGQGLRQVGSLSALTSTTYGRLLLLKLGIVGAVVAVAYVSRSLVRLWRDRGVDLGDESGDGGGETRDRLVAGHLRRSVLVEVLGAMAVLVVTTLLSSVIPARDAQALPYSLTVVGDSGYAQVQVDPARAGTSAVHVTVTGLDGTVPEVEELTVTLTLPERDLGPLDVPMERVTANHFTAEKAEIPFPGLWTMDIAARTGEFDQWSFQLDVPVR